MWLLICNAVIPVVIILIVTLVFVPGPTVPPGTPKAMIWKRKLWELHMGCWASRWRSCVRGSSLRG